MCARFQRRSIANPPRFYSIILKKSKAPLLSTDGVVCPEPCRSQLIADILVVAAAAAAKTDEEIRARIDAVFASPAVLVAQRDEAALFSSVDSSFGKEW